MTRGAWWRVWARFCGNGREPTGTVGNPFPWSERTWSRDLHLAGGVVLYIYYRPDSGATNPENGV